MYDIQQIFRTLAEGKTVVDSLSLHFIHSSKFPGFFLLKSYEHFLETYHHF